MVEKLKQYPVTAITVVAMVLITLLLGDLAWFRKLAVVLLTWWVGVGFEKPVNEMIVQEKLGKFTLHCRTRFHYITQMRILPA